MSENTSFQTEAEGFCWPRKDESPDWTQVMRMVGLPDYGVAFCVSPWPDGGWQAGLFVTDREYVLEQIDRGYLIRGMANVPGRDDIFPDWDIFDGFKDRAGNRVGLRAHGGTADEAISALWDKVNV